MRFPLQDLVEAFANGRVIHDNDSCPCKQGGRGRALGYCMTHAEIAEHIGLCGVDIVRRYLKAGVPFDEADRWACAAGYATITIWPEWEAEADRVYGTDQEEAA